MKIKKSLVFVIMAGPFSILSANQSFTGLTDFENTGTGAYDREIEIIGNDNDSWLTFHDPGNVWYSMGIDYSDGRKLKINYGGIVGDSDHFVMDSIGRIGFGVSSPSEMLHLKSTGPARILIEADSDDATETDNAQIHFSQDGGAVTARIGFATDTNHMEISNNWGNADADINFSTWGQLRMKIDGNGNVGIGVASPVEKLEVNGTIRAKEIIVESTGWSDFVFKDDYQLRSLDEVASFIDDNGHLPDIPSAKEVEANGVTLGEMNAKLLQKIEEITLYSISQEERLKAQEARIQKLENLLTQFKND